MKVMKRRITAFCIISLMRVRIIALCKERSKSSRKLVEYYCKSCIGYVMTYLCASHFYSSKNTIYLIKAALFFIYFRGLKDIAIIIVRALVSSLYFRL